MAFIKTKLSTIRPNDLYDTLRLTYGFNNEEDQKQPGILAKPAEPVSDSDVVAAGFFDYMLTKSRERAAKLRAEAMEQYARDSAEEAAKIRSILGITRSKAPPSDMTASEALDATLPSRESEPVIEGVAPDKPSMLTPEAPDLDVDTRSNEALDKSNQTMSKAIEDVLETVLDSDVSDSTDSADGGAAPSDGKGMSSPTEEESLMADPRGNKRPRARPSNLNLDAPINVRNNNLGNIKNIKRNDWKGQTNLGSDETFAAFSSPELGIRALKKVIQANINATSTIEEYVNRYASEPKEKAYYKENGKLMPHLQNYAIQIAESQGLKNIKKDIPEDVNMLEWIKATAKAEGGADALTYFTDDVIERGLKL